VRCLAVLSMCGVPTRIADGKTPLWRDTKSIKKIANEAVKNVYQHASSPADEKYLGQRKAIALRFRRKYNSDVHRRTCANRPHTPHMRAFEFKHPNRRSAGPCIATSLSDQCTPGLRSAMEGEIASPAQRPAAPSRKPLRIALGWRMRREMTQAARPRHRAGSASRARNSVIINYRYISICCAMNTDRSGDAHAPFVLVSFL
jgi:hypothetical protein